MSGRAADLSAFFSNERLSAVAVRHVSSYSGLEKDPSACVLVWRLAHGLPRAVQFGSAEVSALLCRGGGQRPVHVSEFSHVLIKKQAILSLLLDACESTTLGLC